MRRVLSIMTVTLAATALAIAIEAPADAALPAGVYFQDAGTLTGWSSHYTQKSGVLQTVTSPSYKGGDAIEARQTYVNQTGGYHSEVIKAGAQSINTDRYYGQAIYLPANWQWHDQNVTYQQFSPENPEGPWLLMYVQNTTLRFAAQSIGSNQYLADASTLRGTWIRIVTRIKLSATAGVFEVWVNGVKKISKTGLAFLPSTSQTIRWSSGIYCTGWRDSTPLGQSQLSIFHDQARIANSYALAEPANW